MLLDRIVWEKTSSYVKRNSERFIGDLKELCRQPSVSAKDDGVEECANLVKGMLEDVGISARIIRIKNGKPVVYGEIKSEESKRTLAFYNHYDVQPPEPLEKWLFPPFSAEVHDNKIFARGVADNKGNLVARLKAVEAIVSVMDSSPVTLKFVVEGEEEIGSPTLPLFIKKNRAMLNADGCLWEGARKDSYDRPVICLGSKGILHMELRAKGPERDLHSRWAPIVSNPAWRLILALATIVDADERIVIDGFYDDVLKPTVEEQRMLTHVSEDENKLKEILGVKSFLRESTGPELGKDLLFEPSCTVYAVNSGYPDGKTILPCEATARIHFRLVMRQKPGEVFEKVKRHLAEKGFSDIAVRKVGEMEPTKTSVDEYVTTIGIRAARQVYKTNPVVHPTAPGASPMYYFNNWLKIPTISACGVGYAGSNVHAPNENIGVQDYIEGIKFLTRFILLFGRRNV